MNTYFFVMAVYGRNGNEIGKRVGFVRATNSEEAEDKAWERFGSDSCAFQEIWKADEDGESFTVNYRN